MSRADERTKPKPGLDDQIARYLQILTLLVFTIVLLPYVAFRLIHWLGGGYGLNAGPSFALALLVTFVGAIGALVVVTPH